MLNELDVEVSNTQSLFKLAKEQLALQRRELERQQSLAGKKIITDSDLDKTQARRTGRRQLGDDALETNCNC